MKLKPRDQSSILFIILSSAILLSSVVLAQERTRSLSVGGKDLTNKNDGLEIQILKDKGGKWTQVDQKEEFKAGDKVKVQFWSNINGHVYFVNISPSGKQKVIYRKAIEKDRDYTLPGKEGGDDPFIAFDEEKGVEILKLVMTPSPIKIFDEALQKSEGVLGESVFSVSNELVNTNQAKDKKYEQVAIVSQDGGCPRVRELNIRCRSVGFEPSNSKTGKGSVVVAIPDSTNPSGKLNKDEAIVVEIRLKHV